MTRTRSCAPLAMNCEPTVSEYTNPQHAADRSNPHARDALSLSCTKHAVDGNIMSGVTVPTMMRSTSSAVMPRAVERFLRGGGGELGRARAPFGDAALADAGAIEDPLIRRIDERFEVVVAENFVGEESADGRDGRAAKRHSGVASRGCDDMIHHPTSAASFGQSLMLPTTYVTLRPVGQRRFRVEPSARKA